MLALQLGRPSGIPDRDIDVEMPLNIDVDFTDPEAIFAMQTEQIAANRGKVRDEYSQGYNTITSVSLRPPKLISDDIFNPQYPPQLSEAAHSVSAALVSADRQRRDLSLRPLDRRPDRHRSGHT
jgi:hypothetical protein